MKKRIIKKLTLNKEDVSNLSNEEANKLRGGNIKPTFIDTPHGGYCTLTCDEFTYGSENCTGGCTSACPSVAGGACESETVPVGCLPTFFDRCHSDNACTYAQCTGGCPNTINDGTCGCVPTH